MAVCKSVYLGPQGGRLLYTWAPSHIPGRLSLAPEWSSRYKTQVHTRHHHNTHFTLSSSSPFSSSSSCSDIFYFFLYLSTILFSLFFFFFRSFVLFGLPHSSPLAVSREHSSGMSCGYEKKKWPTWLYRCRETPRQVA